MRRQSRLRRAGFAGHRSEAQVSRPPYALRTFSGVLQEASSKTAETIAAQGIRISHLLCFYFRFFRLFRIKTRKPSKMVDFVRNKMGASRHHAKIKFRRKRWLLGVTKEPISNLEVARL